MWCVCGHIFPSLLFPFHYVHALSGFRFIMYMRVFFSCTFLFANDISINIKQGATPLHAAAMRGHLHMVDYLVTKCKADPHLPLLKVLSWLNET